MGVLSHRELPDHDKIGFIPTVPIQDLLGIGLFRIARFALGVVACGGNHIQKGLGPLAERVHTDLIDL